MLGKDQFYKNFYPKNLLLEFSTRTNIFILGKDPIQGLDDTTLTADA